MAKTFTIELKVPENTDISNIQERLVPLLVKCLDTALWHEADGGIEAEQFTGDEYVLLRDVMNANK